MLYLLVAATTLIVGLIAGFFIGYWHGGFEVEELLEDLDDVEAKLAVATKKNNVLTRLLKHKKNPRLRNHTTEKRVKRVAMTPFRSRTGTSR